MCRAFINAATSEQLKKMYTHVKKIRKEHEKQRNREAEAARVALVKEEKEKRKVAAAALAAELAAQRKLEQEEQALRLAEEERVRQDRRTKKEKREAEKEKRRQEAPSHCLRLLPQAPAAAPHPTALHRGFPVSAIATFHTCLCHLNHAVLAQYLSNIVSLIRLCF